MIHNTVEYWQALQLLELFERDPARRGDELPPLVRRAQLDRGDLPTPRVCRLLQRAFVRWRDKAQWLEERHTGHLFDTCRSERERGRLERRPVAVRKGMAVAKVLDLVTREPAASEAGTFDVHPDELVVGSMPPYSVGQGKELVGYLTGDEELRHAANFLNDRSPFGHTVPDHGVALKGLAAVIGQCEAGVEKHAKGGADARRRAAFYESVKLALEGVLVFAGRYADRAEERVAALADPPPAGETPAERAVRDERRAGMAAVAERLRRVPAKPARSFADAVQCIYIVHCALHTSGEVVPLGRLDQLLGPFYAADVKSGILTRPAAQELIDCLWIKFGERASLDPAHIEDRFTFADGALLGSKGPSNFDQGGLFNQWMQQVTIGGVAADDDPEPTDATNPVTFLCLDAARRLPLNSPTLDLRLHRGSPPELFDAAARTLLSGGAHPVLLNDDLLVPALRGRTGGRVELRSARNYACDGCFETVFAGETEFSFGFVPAVDLLEKTLNRGAAIGTAGPVHLRGSKSSWRTPPAGRLATYPDFRREFARHLELSCHRYVFALLRDYGEKEEVAPSPLLSALIGGCLESGRDVAGGGARYRLFAPLMTGISTCADSLYVIKTLVYERKEFTLDELVACLKQNWKPAPAGGVPEARVAEIHARCREQPKFGHGHRKVDELAWQLVREFCAAALAARDHPNHAAAWARLQKRYGSAKRKFEILLAPGVGTFEQYVFGGGFCGATPDGRRAGEPIASDLSPTPLYADCVPKPGEPRLDPHPRTSPVDAVLASYADAALHDLSDGAPPDLVIAEDFPADRLADVVRRFALGESGNLMTFTAADPATLHKARTDRDGYDLLRVRMGGWTEFFIALFPDHQAQHVGRPPVTP